MTQKFHKGDLIRVADDLGESMRHFEAGCEAIVVGSYADQFGGQNTKDYTIRLKDQGEVSWYHEHQLTLIAASRTDLLREWEDEEATFVKEKSNLDWIFSHGAEVINDPSGASAQALADCFGLTSLWGSWGEGFIYYENKLRTMALAQPFLAKGDKVGWLKFCADNEIVRKRKSS